MRPRPCGRAASDGAEVGDRPVGGWREAYGTGIVDKIRVVI